MEMTMRYAHLSPDVRRDAVRLLDGLTGVPIVQDTIGHGPRRSSRECRGIWWRRRESNRVRPPRLLHPAAPATSRIRATNPITVALASSLT